VVFWVVLITVVVLGTALKIALSRGGKAANPRLRGYGVVIDGNVVKSHGTTLGPLAGARAEVTDGTSRHTLTRVVTVVGAATKRTRAAVIITTADGGFHQQNIQGASELRRAQAWVIRFNTLSATEERKAVQQAGDASGAPPEGTLRQEPSGNFTPAQRERALAYMLRVYAGEKPECDAGTAAFMAGIVRGMGSAQLERARSLTKEQADAAFLQWMRDEHLRWASVAAAS
jgi:hypothetical protein